MPLPKPTKGESERAFVGRCMGDTTMKKEFPQKQRVAVCYAQYRRRTEKKE